MAAAAAAQLLYYKATTEHALQAGAQAYMPELSNAGSVPCLPIPPFARLSAAILVPRLDVLEIDCAQPTAGIHAQGVRCSNVIAVCVS